MFRPPACGRCSPAESSRRREPCPRRWYDTCKSTTYTDETRTHQRTHPDHRQYRRHSSPSSRGRGRRGGPQGGRPAGAPPGESQRFHRLLPDLQRHERAPGTGDRGRGAGADAGRTGAPAPRRGLQPRPVGAPRLRRLRGAHLPGGAPALLLPGAPLGRRSRRDQRIPFVTAPLSLARLSRDFPVLSESLKGVERAAATDAPVLILGEAGTGRSTLARAIHGASPRSPGPLVEVDVGAIPSTLFESELFGYRAGAFTGAEQASDGRAGRAEGGTLVLDHVEELPLATQPKLLRLVAEGRYAPL